MQSPTPSPATALLAALYHESSRPSVAAGTTLAHVAGQAQPFTEFVNLTGDALKGRLNTAAELLERYRVGAILHARIDPVTDGEVEQLAQAIHECERTAVDRGWTVVKLDPPRPWMTFADMPEPAQQGRRKQAKYLLERLVLSPRTGADATGVELLLAAVDRLGEYIFEHHSTNNADGSYKVDPEAVAPHGGEDGPSAALRLLKLAAARGAFSGDIPPQMEALHTALREASDLADQAVITTSSLWHLLAELERLDPNDTELGKTEFRKAVRDIAARRFEYIAEPGPGDADTTDTFAGHVRDSRELAEVRKVLEAAIGRDPDPARSMLEVARDAKALIAFSNAPSGVPTCRVLVNTGDWHEITPTPEVFTKALASAKHLCVAADDLGDVPVIDEPSAAS